MAACPPSQTYLPPSRNLTLRALVTDSLGAEAVALRPSLLVHSPANASAALRAIGSIQAQVVEPLADEGGTGRRG